MPLLYLSFMVLNSLLLLLLIFLILLLLVIRSYNRAVNNKPYGIKYGMYYADGKLIGTETEVMFDPVSGITWLGKTRTS